MQWEIFIIKEFFQAWNSQLALILLVLRNIFRKILFAYIELIRGRTDFENISCLEEGLRIDGVLLDSPFHSVGWTLNRSRIATFIG